MLSKEEYREAVAANGEVYILCERLDMFPDIEQELLSGKAISYRCKSLKESASQWRKMFQDMTKSTFCVKSTSSIRKAGWILCHLRLMCHHYARRKPSKKGKPSPRDTGCPVKLNVRVRRVALANNAKSRSTKPDAGYALKIQSNGVPHNHSTEDMLQHRRLSASTRARVVELLSELRSPLRAWEALKEELQAKYGDRFSEVARDGAMLPNLHYMYDTNSKLFRNDPYDGRRRSAWKLRPAAGKKRRSDPKPESPAVDNVGADSLGLADFTVPDSWLDDSPSEADVPVSVESPQAAAAAMAQQQLESFTRSVVETIATGPDWQMWSKGVKSFTLRWDMSALSGRLALLRGITEPMESPSPKPMDDS